ncbi:MAG TPA: hypothetical protein VFR64_11490 [Methylomirabilota bacterium]|nr:hypothetical protein [Methylomirabilota bacterium]
MQFLTRRLQYLALITLVAVSGCGSGRLVVPVSIETGTLALPSDARELIDPERAVRGIAAILRHDLELPVPEQVTVYVYGSRKVFERGLIQDAHVSPLRAAELSDFAIGVGKRRQLLLNDEGADRQGREWLRLIAHEMAHVCQIELAEGEGRADQWLAEGMAEWVAFAVLERLGLDAMSKRRVAARLGVRSHAALAAARLDLETLGSPRGFTLRHRREGSLPTYQLAYLMADYLIQREGFNRVTAYFRAFSRNQDRRANFEQAFGQRLEEFESEVLAHLRSVVH